MEVNFPIYPALSRLELEYRDQFWTFQYKGDMENISKRVQ